LRKSFRSETNLVRPNSCFERQPLSCTLHNTLILFWSGWCFFNEAHVAVLDGDFRDFANLSDITQQCPQICCMSATIQPQILSELAGILGRTAFSKSISMSPHRSSLSLALRITTDTRSFITGELQSQTKGQRAIIFCLFKNNVSQIAAYIQSAVTGRRVFQCTSGKAADSCSFNQSESAIMVCTTVLAAGVSFEKVTRVYFIDCSHGPEVFLQGAGRGARCEGEQCIATLVTNRQQLETFKDSPTLIYAARMACLCLKCIDQHLNFADEICKLFVHCESEHIANIDQIQNSDILTINGNDFCSESKLQVIPFSAFAPDTQ
jgi:hypothetical protein